MQVQSLGWEDPLEEEMATHSSILAWRIPWMEKPGRLQSMRSQSRTRLSSRAHLKEIREQLCGNLGEKVSKKNETAGAENEARECLATSGTARQPV